MGVVQTKNVADHNLMIQLEASVGVLTSASLCEWKKKNYSPRTKASLDGCWVKSHHILEIVRSLDAALHVTNQLRAGGLCYESEFVRERDSLVYFCFLASLTIDVCRKCRYWYRKYRLWYRKCRYWYRKYRLWYRKFSILISKKIDSGIESIVVGSKKYRYWYGKYRYWYRKVSNQVSKSIVTDIEYIVFGIERNRYLIENIGIGIESIEPVIEKYRTWYRKYRKKSILVSESIKSGIEDIVFGIKNSILVSKISVL